MQGAVNLESEVESSAFQRARAGNHFWMNLEYTFVIEGALQYCAFLVENISSDRLFRRH